ncbi:MAG: glycogen synthase GlgA [Gammaproteobacteria bacterium]|nr:glycogen synthase GlgA [Gammaproteobacteria bacterium]
MIEPPKVLFVTPEVYPLVKTGGLADVSYSLPSALRELGVDARVLVPGYPAVLDQTSTVWQTFAEDVWLLPGVPLARILQGTLPGTEVPLYAIELPALFQRDGGPYQAPDGTEWVDNALRFGVLGKFAALMAHNQSMLSWRPDIVHTNDWQGGLANAYIALDSNIEAASVSTVHNVSFPGDFPPELLGALDLPGHAYQVEGVEFYGRLSFLKAGLQFADAITTVSPTYAEEIQTSEFGGGFEGLFQARSADLSGILNGIDTDVWNPETDRYLPHHYTRQDLSGKAANKAALQQRLQLPIDSQIPLLGLVSRLTYQKGIDVLCSALRNIGHRPFQLAMIGSGDPALENELAAVTHELGARAHLTIGYDESLSHLIEAGSDMFLMPSRFEPCGLNQMYSMRYGTPPIVRRTGGLADSVVDAAPTTVDDGTATGFTFGDAHAGALGEALSRALALYEHKVPWRRLQSNGMSQDFTWTRSASAYLSLYKSLISPSA